MSSPNKKPGPKKGANVAAVQGITGFGDRGAQKIAAVHGEKSMDYAEAKRLLTQRQAAEKAHKVEIAETEKHIRKRELEILQGKWVLREDVQVQGRRVAAVLLATLASTADSFPSLVAGKSERECRALIIERDERVLSAVREALNG